MQRPGTNPQDVQHSDILCDFCHREWADDVAMIEGHQGSCICGKCLTVAFHAVVGAGQDDTPRETGSDDEPGCKCTMCLEERTDRVFQSPMYPEAFICRRCIGLSARALDSDPDHAWTRPKGNGDE